MTFRPGKRNDVLEAGVVSPIEDMLFDGPPVRMMRQKLREGPGKQP